MNESITLAINAISVTMKLLHWFWRHFNITILYPCRLSRIEHPVKSQKLVTVTLFVFGSIPLVSVKKNRAICSTFEWNIAQPVFCRCPVYDASAVGGRADRYFFFFFYLSELTSLNGALKMIFCWCCCSLSVCRSDPDWTGRLLRMKTDTPRPARSIGDR